jgi:hypothetical protein
MAAPSGLIATGLRSLGSAIGANARWHRWRDHVVTLHHAACRCAAELGGSDAAQGLHRLCGDRRAEAR